MKLTPAPQLNLFTNLSDMMNLREARNYDDPKAWQNVSYDEVTCKVNELTFKPLFKNNGMGAPNASIRQLVVMNILKEGYGCSDDVLFEKVGYDLLVRKAMGLVSLEDKAPSIDTYYLFRRRIVDYEAGQLVSAILRHKLEDITKEELDRRNNVEAAMFQVSFHTRNGKTRYRTLVKHVMWANARCLWMNFLRLMKFSQKPIYQGTTAPEGAQISLLGLPGRLSGKIRDFVLKVTLYFNGGSAVQKSNPMDALIYHAVSF